METRGREHPGAQGQRGPFTDGRGRRPSGRGMSHGHRRVKCSLGKNNYLPGILGKVKLPGCAARKGDCKTSC